MNNPNLNTNERDTFNAMHEIATQFGLRVDAPLRCEANAAKGLTITTIWAPDVAADGGFFFIMGKQGGIRAAGLLKRNPLKTKGGSAFQQLRDFGRACAR